MIHRKAVLIASMFFIVAFRPLYAAPNHCAVRIFGGMEPIGRLSASGMGPSGGNLNMETSYGFSPGLEVFFPLGEKVEIGTGCRLQILRRVYRSGGSSDEQFGFLPIYVAARIYFADMEAFRLYGIAKIGYNFFRTNSAFNSILDAGDGGPIESVSGGIYAAGGMGIIYTFKDRPKWGLDFSMDATYGFYRAKGTDMNGDTHRFPYQALSVDLGLDWRF